MFRRSGGTVRAGEETTSLADAYLAGRGLHETRNQAQGRGLAAARRPQQAHQAAVLDGERNVIDDGERSVALGQTAQLNRRHAFSFR